MHPYNLLEQSLTIAKRHCDLFEADARTSHSLGDHDIRVAFDNIIVGSFMAMLATRRTLAVQS
jgi:hypothetical protein